MKDRWIGHLRLDNLSSPKDCNLPLSLPQCVSTLSKRLHTISFWMQTLWTPSLFAPNITSSSLPDLIIERPQTFESRQSISKSRLPCGLQFHIASPRRITFIDVTLSPLPLCVVYAAAKLRHSLTFFSLAFFSRHVWTPFTDNRGLLAWLNSVRHL